VDNLKLGRITAKNPKDAWPTEARHFTPWLADNLALLNEALGLEIELVGREERVGDFAVDIFGKEVGSGHEVIIENQLEATDHSHLGQLLTYAAGLEAKIVVWISPQFREEHRQALDWLNAHSTESVSFFGVQIELLQIGDSLPAPRFNVVVQPSEWQEQVSGRGKREFSKRQIAYHEFFTDLLNRLKARSPGFTTSSRVGYDSWMAFGSGRSGFGFNPSFAVAGGNQFRVELYIDVGDHQLNKSAFDELYAAREAIENEIEEPLTWQRLDEKRACRAFVYQDASIDSSPDTLEQLKDWAVERLIRFKEVFGPRVNNLRIQLPSEIEANP
jgi:hypothetical protein